MEKPCLAVIASMVPAAINVPNRFHIVKKLNEKQAVKLGEFLKCDLRSVNIYLFKEAFDAF